MGFWDAIEKLSKAMQAVIAVSSVAAIVTSAVVVKKVVFKPVVTSVSAPHQDLSRIPIGAEHQYQISRMK